MSSTLQEIHDFWGIGAKNIHGDEFTGYESVYDQLDKFDKPAFNKDPDGTVSSIFDIYRSINLVPIIYFTEKGIIRAIRDFKDTSYNGVKDSRISLGNNRGQPLSRFLFTNMMTAEPKGRGSNSLRDRFFDDKKLKRAIRICYEMREGNHLAYPTALRRALELVTGENVQNFKPQNARAIVEELCPVIWGNVYDYSCGYGGRLLGIGASNMKYNYTGVEPNTETIKYLNYFNECINEAVGVKGNIIQSVSEDYQPTDIDLAFSSPPYFNLEKYSDEDTQCMVRYKTLEDWFGGYVEPTIENIYKGLNSDGIFATNIADYKTYGSKEFKVVEDWIATAERIGFKHVNTIKMMLNTRPGVGNQKLAGREKFEGVYVFRK
jgi:SAM-dependent methyltransferase